MMILLAHLLNLNTEWRQAKLRLRTIVSTLEEQNLMNEKLNALIADSRISAMRDVILNKDGEDVIGLMHKKSKDADIVFVGLTLPGLSDETDNYRVGFAENLNKLVVGFNSTILVRNVEPTEGGLIE
jgi:hypothetical protein